MSVLVWLNGKPLSEAQSGLPLTNRGLHYGDGVFETMLWQSGKVRFFEAHWQRACEGCERLGIAPPSHAQLSADLDQLPCSDAPAIAKLLLIRAGTGRGYKPHPHSDAYRLLLLYPWSEAPETIRVQWCATRWSRNPQLAGLKHLNRLEQVLAQQELGAEIDEGLMLDGEGELISATSGNLFIVRDGVLHTSDLQWCGVRGVMRAQVIAKAAALGIAVEERALWPADLEVADEAFVTNALRGIRPIVSLGERAWIQGEITRQLQRALT